MLKGLVFASFAGLAALTPLHVLAQSLEVHPVSVQLDPGRTTATLELSNHGTVPVTVQVRGFTWTQKTEGPEQLAAAEALVLSPPFITMPAGESQLVRLLVRQPATDREMPYRLLLDQVPLSTDAQGVRLVVHFSVPVFVEPVSIVPAKIDWSLDVSKGGDSTLVAVNNGGQRAQLENLTWSVDGGAASGIPSNGSAYVLSGAERHWQTNGISKRIKKSDSAVNLKVTINGLASNVLVPVVRTP